MTLEAYGSDASPPASMATDPSMEEPTSGGSGVGRGWDGREGTLEVLESTLCSVCVWGRVSLSPPLFYSYIKEVRTEKHK